jgi:hydroxymethylpyrimidine/phosphomethylpyrimidine kinase
LTDHGTPRPVALTVAGSDSGGGAGIQADLRTFARLGAFGTSAVTALTAQNLAGVREVVGIAPASVRAQIEAVVEGFPVRGLKTGMLWSAAIIEEVATLVGAGALPAPVVDPVMVATSGAPLLEPDAVAAYETLLFPRARLITPNLDEAALLLGEAVGGEELEAAAQALAARYGCAVLLKGGHAEGDPVDVLHAGGAVYRHRNERVAVVNTHGSGCTLSAAITAGLAHGRVLEDACAQAITFLQQALRVPVTLEGGAHLIGIEHGPRGAPPE